MKKIILTTAAISLGAMLAAAGTASAEGRTSSRLMPATTAQMKIAPSPVAAKARDNTAYAWTAGCYAEFGPNASDPDAALLEKCLNW
ncbi:hypothetical protein [uncultured Hoeflea sp.]|jgi:hypothetical protein|uniref:hypothetical protein n=1 Tax=uncultured Hoeflea sp. TaxID=538666 RepID=UPI0030DC07B7|tara:strand:- start:1974 stop:2234 length:261 start_codon:yes stop_codon:yes gene_type:complete